MVAIFFKINLFRLLGRFGVGTEFTYRTGRCNIPVRLAVPARQSVSHEEKTVHPSSIALQLSFFLEAGRTVEELHVAAIKR